MDKKFLPKLGDYDDFSRIVNALKQKAEETDNKDCLRKIDKIVGAGCSEKLSALKNLAAELGFSVKLELEPATSREVFYSRIAKALAKDYFCIYYVDIKTGQYEEYGSDERYGRLKIKKSGNNFFGETVKNITRAVYFEDVAQVDAIYNRERIIAELKKSNAITFTYRLIINEKPFYVSSKIISMDDEERHIVIGLSDVDVQVHRREEFEKAKEESLTYTRIAQILAKDYFSIYDINIDTDEYAAYSSEHKSKTLKQEEKGFDFFNLGAERILRDVCEEDRNKVLVALQKNTLLAETTGDRSFSVAFRQRLNGVPTYVRLKAMRTDYFGGNHILIGVKNIDEQIRRERSYIAAIDTARALADKDALTGVKSKHAYAEAEKALNAKIRKKRNLEFAIVVCDVNDLKAVNDTFGHKAGDDHIKAGCSVVCNVFKRSPVYRIGGDEFAVILQGADYEQRFLLMEAMDNKMGQNITLGEVVVACGMADFSAEDKNVAVVFNRADEAMYKNKTSLKNR
ncbi:MAG: GGDEF domain-containing protein [Clostridia bacterium]|nr:GGDEF domain-containing protein [Clostridia bacterium]